MQKDSLDMSSPYIKSNVYGIDKIRKNILSFNGEESREPSDSLLRQKISNISKKIVGEEIKKFAEIASKEITNEFETLEKRAVDSISINVNKRIDFVEQNLYDNLALQNENISILGIELEKDLNSKLEKINYVYEEMERRIKDLEILSNNPVTTVKNDKSKNKTREETEDPEYTLNLSKMVNREKKEEPIIEIIKEVVDSTPTTIDSTKKHPVEKTSEEELSNTSLDYEEKVSYINEKLKVVLKMFEKNGFLFKKNTFMSSFKDLDVEHFLNKQEDYTDLPEEDKEKMSTILIDLMDTVNINPKETETIGDFLKRAFLKEYNLDKLKLNKD